MRKPGCRFGRTFGMFLTAGLLISGINLTALPVYAEEGAGAAIINNTQESDNSKAVMRAVYQELTSAIKEIAQGTRTSTSIDVFERMTGQLREREH